jgi:signal transduction histidine kinase
LPIRARLTIAFAGVMALVLGAAGIFLYSQLERDLDAEINASLREEANSLATLVEQGRGGTIAGSEFGIAQIYDPDGGVFASTLRARGGRLLTRSEAARAAEEPLRFDGDVPRSGAARIYALPASAGNGPPRAVAVAQPFDRRDHELARLRTLLLIAGPLALLLASFAGYELARAALRSVNRMRAQAERITERELSERLPVGSQRDEITALGHTLNAMLDRLERAVSRERRLVSDASHELRTPLTTLRAEVDLALSSDRGPDELRAALESAAGEARRMTRLADDLLVLARADQGRLPLNPELVPARELMESAAARASSAAQLRGRRLVVRDVLGEDGLVYADPDRTAQVLDNLITNALRYGDGTITLTAEAGAESVELHVTDEGPGFPDEVVVRPFERFGRGPEARAAGPGSGLGLALVLAVASAHGGEAHARNRPEGGADVWITLPRRQPRSL